MTSLSVYSVQKFTAVGLKEFKIQDPVNSHPPLLNGNVHKKTSPHRLCNNQQRWIKVFFLCNGFFWVWGFFSSLKLLLELAI